MCGLYTHTIIVTPRTLIAPKYFIYIPQHMLPAVCVTQTYEHFSQSIPFDCTPISFICVGVCVATSTTHFYCMHNSYTAVYLCGLCGYFHHTILHCMHNLYTAAYLCGLCGYLYHPIPSVCTTCIPQHTSAVCVATFTTKFSLYAQLVYRSISLRSAWPTLPHNFHCMHNTFITTAISIIT